MTQPTLFGGARKRPSIGRARKGLDITVKTLRETGRLDLADEAVIALSRIAADQLDAACADAEESRYTRGTLIARYAAVLTELTARRGLADDTDGDLAALLAAMGDSPQSG